MDYDSWDALVQYLFKKVGLSVVVVSQYLLVRTV
jgi:hypothetical protein